MIAQNGVHLQWPTKQMPISDLGYVCAYEYMANIELLHGCQMTEKPRPTF